MNANDSKVNCTIFSKFLGTESVLLFFTNKIQHVFYVNVTRVSERTATEKRKTVTCSKSL